MKGFVSHRLTSPTSGGSQPTISSVLSVNPPKPKLLDQVRQSLRACHYSRRTEEVYVMWIKRFIFFHKVRHPAEMGARKSTLF